MQVRGLAIGVPLGMLRRAVIAVVVLFIAIQFVPYGHDRSNPPVTQDAPWPSAEARRIAKGACYDCHSNETKWQWYDKAAPASWLVQRDIENGRDKLNFSEWNSGDNEDDLVEAVEDGSMPPRPYRLLHPGARLSAKEKAALIKALAELEAFHGHNQDRDD